MDIFTIDVGFTTVRPIIVDQHISRVMVEAKNLNDAMLLASQIVGSHSIMPTSTKLIRVEI